MSRYEIRGRARRETRPAPRRNAEALLAAIRAKPGQTARALRAHHDDLIELEMSGAAYYQPGSFPRMTDGSIGGSRRPGTWWPRLIAMALTLLALAGCAGARDPQAFAADAMARVANAGGPLLVEAYERDPRPTVEVDAAYAPVWAAWRAFRAAHDAWATALEQRAPGGPEPSPEPARLAYCALVAALPPERAEFDPLVVPGVCQ